MLESMVQHGTVYMWGPCLLGMVYFQLHDVAYRGIESELRGAFVDDMGMGSHNSVPTLSGMKTKCRCTICIYLSGFPYIDACG